MSSKTGSGGWGMEMEGGREYLPSSDAQNVQVRCLLMWAIRYSSARGVGVADLKHWPFVLALSCGVRRDIHMTSLWGLSHRSERDCGAVSHLDDANNYGWLEVVQRLLEAAKGCEVMPAKTRHT